MITSQALRRLVFWPACISSRATTSGNGSDGSSGACSLAASLSSSCRIDSAASGPNRAAISAYVESTGRRGSEPFVARSSVFGTPTSAHAARSAYFAIGSSPLLSMVRSNPAAFVFASPRAW